VLPENYRRGVIGKRDRTMEPMILAGSIVLIDIQKNPSRAEKIGQMNLIDQFIFS
jgi:hypothetical protein